MYSYYVKIIGSNQMAYIRNTSIEIEQRTGKLL